jgi:hypothetical protein
LSWAGTVERCHHQLAYSHSIEESLTGTSSNRIIEGRGFVPFGPELTFNLGERNYPGARSRNRIEITRLQNTS